MSTPNFPSGSNVNYAHLVARDGINTVIGFLLDQANGKFEDYVIEQFYDRLLLDKIKLGTEEYVHVRYAQTREVPKGHGALKLRRPGALTEHTIPLSEGVPPLSDKTRMESITAIYAQYGRYMEFSDRVDFMTLDPIIALYTVELGDVAVRTAERLAREELLSAPLVFFPNGRASVGELIIGDKITISDYRLQTLRMKRLLVKPYDGINFHVLVSPEMTFDLVMDPLVQTYMENTNRGTNLETGKPPELFNLKWQETMLDEFGYGHELHNPGQYYDFTDWNGYMNPTYKCRILAIDTDHTEYYINLPERISTTQIMKEYGGDSNRDAYTAVDEKYNRLKDGSFIPFRRVWDIELGVDSLPVGHVVTTVTRNAEGVPTIVNKTVHASTDNATHVTVAKLQTLSWRQLPVHRSIMLGQESLVKTGISGESGAKMYIKQKGSAGVLDPIDQRQSIGFKINSLGFTLLRPEAVCVFFSVPDQAVLTAEAVHSRYMEEFPYDIQKLQKQQIEGHGKYRYEKDGSAEQIDGSLKDETKFVILVFDEAGTALVARHEVIAGTNIATFLGAGPDKEGYTFNKWVTLANADVTTVSADIAVKPTYTQD